MIRTFDKHRMSLTVSAADLLAEFRHGGTVVLPGFECSTSILKFQGLRTAVLPSGYSVAGVRGQLYKG
jgi:hypothetical protein